MGRPAAIWLEVFLRAAVGGDEAVVAFDDLGCGQAFEVIEQEAAIGGFSLPHARTLRHEVPRPLADAAPDAGPSRISDRSRGRDRLNRGRGSVALSGACSDARGEAAHLRRTSEPDDRGGRCVFGELVEQTGKRAVPEVPRAERSQ